MKYYGYTNQGVRLENQDSFTIYKNDYNFLIAAIADGMGGHKGGKIASTLTIKIVEFIFKKIDFNKMNDNEIKNYMIESVKKIRGHLVQETEIKNLSPDMGTTLNLNIFVNDKIFTLNIGDSRATHFYKKNIYQISEDHNFSTLAKIDSTFSEYEKYSNYLTSALGPNKDSKADVFVTTKEKAGKLIITSDGVHNYLNKEKMLKILKLNLTTKEKVERIVIEALQNKSTDNATCVMVEYGN